MILFTAERGGKMISNERCGPFRFFVAGAVAFASLLSPAWAVAQAVPLGSSAGVFRPMAGSVSGTVADPVAASTVELRPTATISERANGAVHESFEITITFSENVVGFTLSDIRITGGRGIDFSGGTSTSVYTFTLLPTDGFQGELRIRIPESAASGASGNSLAAAHDFDVDNRPPRALRADVNRRTLRIEFDEDLDETRSPPDASAFRVDVIDVDNDVTRAEIDGIDIEDDEVTLTLATGVRHDDFIELFYSNDGANALRDPTGNLALEFGVDVRVRNTTIAGAGAPGAPTNLEADPDGATAIDLVWTVPANHGDDAIRGYQIEVSRDGGNTWTDLVADTELTTTTYRHTGLAAGDTRHYRVSAINSLGAGPPSNVASATTVSRVPGPPTGLVARATGTTTITLTWRSPTSGTAGPITGYLIEVANRSTGPWTVLEGDTRSRSTTYVHRNLPAGTTRYYRVSGINTAGSGRLSNVADATTEAAAPPAPTNLRAVPSGPGGSRALLLTWTRPSHDGGSSITGYRIEVSTTGFSGWTALVANTGSRTTRYEHPNLTPGTTRHYRVAAINALGRGGFSNVATGATNAAPPDAPRSLRVTAEGPNSISLTWEPPLNTGGARIIGYRIWRSGSAQGAFLPIQSNTGTTTTFLDTNLLPATTYHYQVAALNSVGVGQRSPAASTTTHAAVPGAPAGLTARAVGTSRIELSWRPPTNTGGARILGYRIEVSRDGGANWTILRANTGSIATSFTDPGLQPGSRRYYRVSAINTAGVGAPSRVAWATTEAVLPGAPIGLRARAAGSTAIDLSWDPPLSDGGATISGYRIEASRSRTSGWMVIRASTRSTATTYQHTNLFAGSTWYYRVSAINAKGAGPASGVATGMTDATPPGQPQGLRASAENASSIKLTWQAPADIGGAMITGYRIEVAPSSHGPWTPLLTDSHSTATTYTHTGLPPVTTRFYRVSAINRAGIGRATVSVSATTLPAVPAPPTGMTATARGTSRIDLSWRTPSNDGGSRIIGYRIEVSSDAGRNWRILRRNTGSTTTTFAHTGLLPASTRFYRVSAVNLAGTGRPSNVARATTEATVPNAPRNLAANASGTSQINLTWDAPTTDGGAVITGYRIEISDNGGATWQTLAANTRSITTRYTHDGLAPASTRHYRVSAINRVGVSAASGVASATTDATVPDAPTGLAATATSPTQIDLTWAAPAYDGGAAISGYRIEVSVDGTTWQDLQPNTGTPGTSYSHTGLQPGSRRFYRVSAINVAGIGAPSAIASAATDDPVERAGRLNSLVLPDVAAAMTSSTFGAIADRIDAVASGMATRRRIEMGSLSSMAARFYEPGAGGAGPGRDGGSGASWLFDGSSFVLPLGATDAPQSATAGSGIATWGAGDFTRLGEPNATTLDWKGDLLSFHVGMDMRVRSDVLAGLAATRSSGSFDFTDKTGANPVKGTYGATMNSVNPYVAWLPDRRGTAVWAAGGFGWGEVEINDERAGLRTAPTTMMTGAAGGSRQLFTRGVSGLKVKAEGWAGQAVVDETEQVDRAVMNLQRGRLALEWTQAYRTANGTEFAVVLEGGGRYDNGAGANGAGAEVGGGLKFSSTRWGVSAEGRGRMLVTGSDDYEEWGVGAVVQIDRGERGQGLSIRLSPSYGDASSGLNQLWERGVADQVYGRDTQGRTNVDGEVAYGMAGFQGMPYGGFHLAGDGHRAFSSGLKYDLGRGLGLRIEGTRRESRLGGPRHSVGVRGRLQFR